MSNFLLTAAWTSPCRTPAAKLVLVKLADMANDKGCCWPSVKRICRECGLGERTVFRAIEANVRSGHLTVKPVPGRTSEYRIHPCHSGTPAKLAPLPERHTPLPKTTKTPAKLAPKPSGTIIEPSEASGRSMKEMYQEALAKELNGER